MTTAAGVEVESTGGGHTLIEDRKKSAAWVRTLEGGMVEWRKREKCHFHFHPYCGMDAERRLRNV